MHKRISYDVLCELFAKVSHNAAKALDQTK